MFSHLLLAGCGKPSLREFLAYQVLLLAVQIGSLKLVKIKGSSSVIFLLQGDKQKARPVTF